jgi:hypothetical protein
MAKLISASTHSIVVCKALFMHVHSSNTLRAQEWFKDGVTFARFLDVLQMTPFDAEHGHFTSFRNTDTTLKRKN